MSNPVCERVFDVSAGAEKLELRVSFFSPQITPTKDFTCKFIISEGAEELASREIGGADSLQALLMAVAAAGVDVESIALEKGWSIPDWSLADFQRLLRN